MPYDEEVIDVFEGHGIEISIKRPDDFLIIRETLTRVGIQSTRKKELYQSAHILHKRGRYAIVHFKEMFALDGRDSTVSDDDLMRRNTIVELLESWGLCSVVESERDIINTQGKLELSKIKIVPHEEKEDWVLTPKYHFGSKKK